MFDTSTIPAERRLVETMDLGDGRLSGAMRRARDALCADALARGLTLVLLSDWTELERVNRANLDSWLPIMHQPAGEASFWIAAVDAEGEVKATQAGVLMDCTARSFGDRLSDLSFFYADPAREAARGEFCFCASEAAYATDGRACYITAGWTHPTARGQGLFHLVGRAVRMISLARWEPRWWVGMVAPETVPQWSEKKAGRRFLERRPTILYRNPAAGYDYPPLRLLRFCRSGVMLDVQSLAARQS